MTDWEKILKFRVPAYPAEAKEKIVEHYTKFSKFMDEILKQIEAIDFDGSPEEAQTQWNQLSGGLKDIEGWSNGFKEVHDNMTMLFEGV